MLVSHQSAFETAFVQVSMILQVSNGLHTPAITCGRDDILLNVHRMSDSTWKLGGQGEWCLAEVAMYVPESCCYKQRLAAAMHRPIAVAIIGPLRMQAE